MGTPEEARGIVNRGVPAQQAEPMPPLPDDLRKRRLDEVDALTIELFHGQPLESGVELFGYEHSIAKVRRLHDDKFAGDVGPRTKKAAAKALLAQYAFYQDLANRAPRGAGKQFLQDDPRQGVSPWTKAQPKQLAEIAPFTPDNVRRWRQINTTPLPKPQLAQAAAPSSTPRLPVQTQPLSPFRPYDSSQPRTADYERANALAVTLFKTPQMSFATKEGRLAILGAVLEQVREKEPEEASTKNTSPDLEAIARQLIAENTFAVFVEKDEQVTNRVAYFDEQAVGYEFKFKLDEASIQQISKHLKLPYKIRYLRPLKSGAQQSLEDHLRKLKPNTKEYERVKNDLKRFQPNPSMYEIHPNVTQQQRMLYALTRMRREKAIGPYVPGQTYGDGAIFIHYVGNPHEQVWLMPNGRLYRINDRALQLDAFARGVVSAAPMVTLGYALMLVAPAIIFAPQAAAFLSTRVAPAMLNTIRAGAGTIRAVPSLARATPRALASMRNLTLADMQAFATQLGNSERLLMWTELAVGLSLPIANDPDEFMKNIRADEGKLQFFVEVGMELLVVWASGGFPGSGGARNRPKVDLDLPQAPKTTLPDIPNPRNTQKPATGRPNDIERGVATSESPATTRPKPTDDSIELPPDDNKRVEDLLFSYEDQVHQMTPEIEPSRMIDLPKGRPRSMKRALEPTQHRKLPRGKPQREKSQSKEAIRRRERLQAEKLAEQEIVIERFQDNAVPESKIRKIERTDEEQIAGIPEVEIGDPNKRRRYNNLDTPTTAQQKRVQALLPANSPDPAFPELRVGTAEADHIIPLETIRKMPGFALLERKRQKTVANYDPNIEPMSEAANKSRGDKSFEDWKEHKELGLKVNEAFRQRMIKKEGHLKVEIQSLISDLLRQQMQETPH